jgi:hypothetical protein
VTQPRPSGLVRGQDAIKFGQISLNIGRFWRLTLEADLVVSEVSRKRLQLTQGISTQKPQITMHKECFGGSKHCDQSTERKRNIG